MKIEGAVTAMISEYPFKLDQGNVLCIYCYEGCSAEIGPIHFDQSLLNGEQVSTPTI